MKAKFLSKTVFNSIDPNAGTLAMKADLIKHGFLVVMENGSFVGVLTPEDIIKSPYNLVLDCLQKRPFVDYEEPVDSILEQMKTSGFSCLPVFKEGRFFGVIQETDIMEFFTGYSELLERRVKEYTEGLRASEEKYRGMMEAMTDPVFICSKDLIIEYLNPAMIRRIGRDVTGEICFRAIHEMDHRCEWCVLENILSGESIETKLQSPKDKRYFRINNIPFRNNDGSFSKMAIYRDITDYLKAKSEMEKASAHLQQVQKMEAVGTLAGGIAHDFNNILCAITGNISYALSRLRTDEELFEVLSDVQAGAGQAQTLTQQLLTFAKGGDPIKKMVDINHLLKKIIKFVVRGAKAKCKFILSDDLWAAEVDEGQFNQVISNLVINAGQSMPSGGIITIRSENVELDANNHIHLKAGPYIKIQVEDQGEGIPEEHLSSLFDPYFTTKPQGSGLGLSTAYSIVKKHGGFISVETQSGVGSRFIVYLPASIKKRLSKLSQAISVHQGSGKILIMDDEEIIQDVAQRMFNQMGYQTELASNGEEALGLFRRAQTEKNPFDLVILDLTVPGGMGGVKMMSELIKIDPNVKAIVSSGYANDSVMANYQDYGFCGNLSKPFTMHQLAALLNRICGKTCNCL